MYCNAKNERNMKILKDIINGMSLIDAEIKYHLSRYRIKDICMSTDIFLEYHKPITKLQKKIVNNRDSLKKLYGFLNKNKRIFNALVRANVLTIEKLLEINDFDELDDIIGISNKSVIYIRNIIEKRMV